MNKLLFSVYIIIQTSYPDLISSSCNDLFGHERCKLLPGDKCGAVSNSRRIVGGKDASLGQYPWMALVYINGTFSNGSRITVPFCGGSVITTRHVLTAAHCVPDHPIKLSHVRVGEHDLSTTKDCTADGRCAPEVQDISISSYLMHEDYDSKSLSNDIVLLCLQSSINFSLYVAPICLPVLNMFHSDAFQLQNTIFDVAGWGVTNSTTDEKSTVLQTLKVPFVTLSECQASYEEVNLTDKQICAGGVKGEDSCAVDSGGPLMGLYSAHQSEVRYYQIGIVSQGSTECGIGLPAIHTKVMKFVTWILHTLDKLK